MIASVVGGGGGGVGKENVKRNCTIEPAAKNK